MNRNIVVLGGGSAGLLAALSLKARLPQLAVRVVHSREIGITGVGEGSTAHERFSDHASVDRGLQPKLQVAGDLLEGVPNLHAILEEHAMLGVIQIEKIVRCDPRCGLL